MRRSFVETKAFTAVLFSAALVLVVVGLLSGREPVWELGLVCGWGGLIKLLAVDI